MPKKRFNIIHVDTNPIQITIDSEYNCWYFTFTHNKISKTIPFGEKAYIDFDKNDKVVGVELICVNKISPVLRQLVKEQPAFNRVAEVIKKELERVS